MDLGWLVNTAVLLFLAGLMIGYGKWVGSRIMNIQETLASWGPRIALVDRNDAKLAELERNFAVHCATPHCGEWRAEGPHKP